MVTLLEYGQVIYGKDAEAEAIAPVIQGNCQTRRTRQIVTASQKKGQPEGYPS